MVPVNQPPQRAYRWPDVPARGRLFLLAAVSPTSPIGHPLRSRFARPRPLTLSEGDGPPLPFGSETFANLRHSGESRPFTGRNVHPEGSGKRGLAGFPLGALSTNGFCKGLSEGEGMSDHRLVGHPLRSRFARPRPLTLCERDGRPLPFGHFPRIAWATQPLHRPRAYPARIALLARAPFAVRKGRGTTTPCLPLVFADGVVGYPIEVDVFA